MAGDGQKNTLHDNALGWLIMAGVFAAVFFLFWHYFEYQTKDAIRWLRISEAKMVAVFVSENYTVNIDGDEIPLEASIKDMEQIPATNLDGPMLGLISRIALEPIKLPLAIIMGLMGLWALTSGPGTQYRRRMNLDGIIGAQSRNFHSIRPFIKFNPSSMPPRAPGSPVHAELPLFAEALGPEEWVAYNRIPLPDGKLDQEAAYIAFSRQLGARWQGALRLAPYKQVILAAFCLKAARKRIPADELLGRLATCWSQDKGLQLGKDKTLLKEARTILKNRDLAGSTLSKCNQHAFETTALLRGLQTAREEGGVLAPAQFVWLRGYDRILWYPLNNLGRQAFHMEALGAMAHFKAEKLTRRPIPRPKLDYAVNSITDYIQSARSRPIPQLDYSKSKQRGIKQPKAAVKKAQKPPVQKKKKGSSK
ncbi:MAG: type IV secretion system protein [Alphaproteobacteria bacterium CG_4_9_14_3_um_filter_47_13]|nr:MAG: type IV secretion system protein [Alphaproteobacteria bacterium CG_4_9_14_3_um_filter_47_13]